MGSLPAGWLELISNWLFSVDNQIVIAFWEIHKWAQQKFQENIFIRILAKEENIIK